MKRIEHRNFSGRLFPLSLTWRISSRYFFDSSLGTFAGLCALTAFFTLLIKPLN